MLSDTDKADHNILTVWESEQAWREATASPVTAEASKYMKELIHVSDPPVVPYYYNAILFDKSFAQVASAPLVQITSIFVSKAVDRAEFDAVIEGVLAPLLQNMPDGFVAGAHGWALLDGHRSEKMPEGSMVFVTASGWESIEKKVAGHARIAERFAEVSTFSDVVQAVGHHSLSVSKPLSFF